MEDNSPILATTQIGGLCLILYLLLGVTTITLPMSPLRVPAMVAILSLAVSIQIAVQLAPHLPVFIRGSMAMGAWVEVFNSYDILLHSRISYIEQMEWERRRGSITLESATHFALTVPSNFRRLGTKWQVVPVYRFDSKTGRIPQKAQFIRSRIQSIFYILALSIVVFQAGLHVIYTPSQSDLFVLLNETCLLSIPSLGSVPFHLHLTLFFIATMFLLLKAIYAILSVVAVFLGLSSPAQWPPFHTSLDEAWSTRRFWGRFWHQTFRGFLPSPGNYISRDVFGLAPGTIPARYVHYVSCFLISGMIHLFFDLAIGIPFQNTGALRFFLVQPIAFAVEDATNTLSNRYGMLRGNTAAKKSVGYIWVVLFSVWSWRPWAYPVLTRALEIGEPITSTYFHIHV